MPPVSGHPKPVFAVHNGAADAYVAANYQVVTNHEDRWTQLIGNSCNEHKCR
ncbi:MAG: hypothetical protein R2847_07625 [Bacteroidia bacterium]